MNSDMLTTQGYSYSTVIASSSSGTMFGSIFGTAGFYLQYSSGNVFVKYYVIGGGNTYYNFTVPSYNSTAPVLITITSSSSGLVSVYENGTISNAIVFGTYGFSPNNLIGQTGAGGPQFTGNIGEIIMYSRQIKNSERADVESYLARKWNINCCIQ